MSQHRRQLESKGKGYSKSPNISGKDSLHSMGRSKPRRSCPLASSSPKINSDDLAVSDKNWVDTFFPTSERSSVNSDESSRKSLSLKSDAHLSSTTSISTSAHLRSLDTMRVSSSAGTIVSGSSAFFRSAPGQRARGNRDYSPGLDSIEDHPASEGRLDMKSLFIERLNEDVVSNLKNEDKSLSEGDGCRRKDSEDSVAYGTARTKRMHTTDVYEKNERLLSPPRSEPVFGGSRLCDSDRLTASDEYVFPTRDEQTDDSVSSLEGKFRRVIASAAEGKIKHAVAETDNVMSHEKMEQIEEKFLITPAGLLPISCGERLGDRREFFDDEAERVSDSIVLPERKTEDAGDSKILPKSAKHVGDGIKFHENKSKRVTVRLPGIRVDKDKTEVTSSGPTEQESIDASMRGIGDISQDEAQPMKMHLDLSVSEAFHSPGTSKSGDQSKVKTDSEGKSTKRSVRYSEDSNVVFPFLPRGSDSSSPSVHHHRFPISTVPRPLHVMKSAGTGSLEPLRIMISQAPFIEAVYDEMPQDPYDDTFFPTEHKLNSSEAMRKAMEKARAEPKFKRFTRPDGMFPGARYVLPTTQTIPHYRMPHTTRGELQVKYRHILSRLYRHEYALSRRESLERAGMEDTEVFEEEEGENIIPQSAEEYMRKGRMPLEHNMSNAYGMGLPWLRVKKPTSTTPVISRIRPIKPEGSNAPRFQKYARSRCRDGNTSAGRPRAKIPAYIRDNPVATLIGGESSDIIEQSSSRNKHRQTCFCLSCAKTAHWVNTLDQCESKMSVRSLEEKTMDLPPYQMVKPVDARNVQSTEGQDISSSK